MKPLKIGDSIIKAGESLKIELPVAKLYTDTDVSIPVHIIRSKREGPTIFISAAVHGDELNGIEIIRRLIKEKKFKLTHGTIIAVPMVNVYGVLNQSRYMPDRRDLNRSFPGSSKGSLASRFAHTFLKEIVKHCDYGIDLHTGAIHRSNLPQIRANLEDPKTKELAEVFGVPVLLNSNLIDGSLRNAASKYSTKILLYEAGEALRFDELSIRAGMKGVMNVLRHLEMVKKVPIKKRVEPFVANTSNWVRANASGIVHNKVKLGQLIQQDQVLAEIGSPFGDVIANVIAPNAGVIIGQQNIPLVQEGEAMFHIAQFKGENTEVQLEIENSSELLLQKVTLAEEEPNDN